MTASPRLLACCPEGRPGASAAGFGRRGGALAPAWAALTPRRWLCAWLHSWALGGRWQRDGRVGARPLAPPAQAQTLARAAAAAVLHPASTLTPTRQGIMGVIDGLCPVDFETDSDKEKRRVRGCLSGAWTPTRGDQHAGPFFERVAVPARMCRSFPSCSSDGRGAQRPWRPPPPKHFAGPSPPARRTSCA